VFLFVDCHFGIYCVNKIFEREPFIQKEESPIIILKNHSNNSQLQSTVCTIDKTGLHSTKTSKKRKKDIKQNSPAVQHIIHIVQAAISLMDMTDTPLLKRYERVNEKVERFKITSIRYCGIMMISVCCTNSYTPNDNCA
jgi:hypothetical protein